MCRKELIELAVYDSRTLSPVHNPSGAFLSPENNGDMRRTRSATDSRSSGPDPIRSGRKRAAR
jgi:hypothetical protein